MRKHVVRSWCKKARFTPPISVCHVIHLMKNPYTLSHTIIFLTHVLESRLYQTCLDLFHLLLCSYHRTGAPPCCWCRRTRRSRASATAPNLKAEVCGIQQDGLHLQARSQKYGKLERGQLLTVPPYLVRRRKQHFHHLEQCGVDLILRCNGFIWVGEYVEAKDDMVEDQASKLEQQNIKSNKNSISLEEQEQTYTLLETRQSICRIANAVGVLSILGFNIAIEVIMDTMNLNSSLNLDIHEMLDSELCSGCRGRG